MMHTLRARLIQKDTPFVYPLCKKDETRAPFEKLEEKNVGSRLLAPWFAFNISKNLECFSYGK